jgi:hypothetical protein
MFIENYPAAGHSSLESNLTPAHISTQVVYPKTWPLLSLDL